MTTLLEMHGILVGTLNEEGNSFSFPELAIENAGLFNLDKPSAKAICKEVEAAVGTWRSVAQ